VKPEVNQILMITAGQIAAELTPHLASQYTQGVAQLSALMAILSAQEYDRAAEIRAVENHGMRALFAELAPLVTDARLKAKLNEQAGGQDASLRVSALNRANYALRDLLIALHEHIEGLNGEAARKAETRIWALLGAFADRRQLHLPQA